MTFEGREADSSSFADLTECRCTWGASGTPDVVACVSVLLGR